MAKREEEGEGGGEEEGEEGKWGEIALGAEMLQCLCGLPPRITEHPLTDECRRAQ